MQRRDFLRFAAYGCVFSTASGRMGADETNTKTGSSAVIARDDVLDIGSTKQLFVDGFIIESLTGGRIVMNPPYQSRRPVIVKDQPWELHEGCSIGGYDTVRKENGRIRMWYRMNHAYRPLIWKGRDYGSSVFYAESEDGVRFTKPKLGLHDFYGSKANNLVIPGPVQGGTVWIDPRADRKDRYRLQGNGPGGLNFFSSPDGIRWRKTHVVMAGKVDGRSNIFWDDAVGRYILYTRYWQAAAKPSPKGEGGYRGQRWVRRMESDDLVHWNNSKIVLQPDEVDLASHPSAIEDQPPVDYNFSALFRYPDENGLWFMLVTTYWHWFDRSWMGIKTPTGYNLGPNANDVRLAVSRDGVNFSWVGDRAVFLRLGMAGTFDSMYVAEIPFPIQMGNEIWFYYFGRNWEHGMLNRLDPAAAEKLEGIGRALMRIDGFVSVDAGYAGGDLVTKPLRFSGKRLLLNVDAGGGGEIRVEIQNLSGRPVEGYSAIDCRSVNSNSPTCPVVWRNSPDVAALAGQLVKLKFLMQDCKLYAFQFEPS